jgi:hypothetical protein
MPWKKEYAANRRLKSVSDPEYRAKRNAQSTTDKVARAQYMKAYYLANPEKFPKRTPEQQAKYNESRRKKYAEHEATREALKKAAKEWQIANPKKRHAQRLRKYGLTPQQFDSMMTLQSGACAICKTKEKGFPMIDHCHSTGRVRGLLCMQCNQGIGKLKDSEMLLRAAIKYLKTRG